ncbi:hypothetical protein FVE85_1203 [Porphyridium purpureum]|uniref:Uncharacterized protein n=1 Tax=Porphyridium purpureum TaxID=35688 RepID=A0A5J4YFN3_PORPP|nr:hypothetical protein FVE85_8538 [Porphyridium purpureum]KAA8490414.1 hypothetical protein FVE85_1203 [Porphyridium purpureum]|eukprot:POR4886..scf244_28
MYKSLTAWFMFNHSGLPIQRAGTQLSSFIRLRRCDSGRRARRKLSRARLMYRMSLASPSPVRTSAHSNLCVRSDTPCVGSFESTGIQSTTVHSAEKCGLGERNIRSCGTSRKIPLTGSSGWWSPATLNRQYLESRDAVHGLKFCLQECVNVCAREYTCWRAKGKSMATRFEFGDMHPCVNEGCGFRIKDTRWKTQKLVHAEMRIHKKFCFYPTPEMVEARKASARVIAESTQIAKPAYACTHDSGHNELNVQERINGEHEDYFDINSDEDSMDDGEESIYGYDSGGNRDSTNVGHAPDSVEDGLDTELDVARKDPFETDLDEDVAESSFKAVSKECQDIWEFTMSTKSLRTRLRNPKDPLTALACAFSESSSSDTQAVEDSIEMLRFKCTQNSVMSGCGITSRTAGKLKKLESKLLRICLRRALGRVTSVVGEELRREALQDNSICRIRDALRARIPKMLDREMQLAAKLQWNPRTREKMSKAIGNKRTQTRTTNVTFAQGRNICGIQLENGIQEQVQYREPLEIIVRSAAIIIQRHGLRTFHVDVSSGATSDKIVCAQDGHLVRNAGRKIRAEIETRYGIQDAPKAVLLPIQVFADEAHMTKNGRHALTPLQIRVMHREMFGKDSVRDPTVVTFLPNVSRESVQKVVGQTHPSLDDKNLKNELNSALWHRIQHEVFRHVLKANVLGIPVNLGDTKLLLVPMFYKLSMDMPMIAKMSFTKLPMISGTRGQKMPCQQCMVGSPTVDIDPPDDNQDRIHDFWVTTKPVVYRNELESLNVVKNHFGAVGESKRSAESLHFIGRPVAEGWNRFDPRGRFQICGVDGLHGFLAFWLRGVCAAAPKALLTRPDTQTEVKKIMQRLTTLQTKKRAPKNPESSLLWTLDTDDENSDTDNVHGSDGNMSASHLPSKDNWNLCATRQTKKRKGAAGRSGDDPDAEVVGPPRELAVSQRKGSSADQLRAIIDSGAGKKWKVIARVIFAEGLHRRHAVYTPMRQSPFLQELTKFAEHTYSLGFLLQMIMVVSQESILSPASREAYVHLGCKAIQTYTLLYREGFQSEDIAKVATHARELQKSLHLFKKVVGLPWNAPKIHALTHFAESIADCGPLKFWDTTDGEKAFKKIKEHFKSTGVWNHRDLISRMMRRVQQDEETQLDYMYTERCDQISTSSVEPFSELWESTKHGTQVWRRFGGTNNNDNLQAYGKWPGAHTRFDVCGSTQTQPDVSWMPVDWNPAETPVGTSNPNEVLWHNVDEELRRFVMLNRMDANSFSVEIYAYRQIRLARDSLPVETIVAYPNHYGCPRWDLVEIRNPTTDLTEFAYGKCILIAKIVLTSGIHTKTISALVIQRFADDVCGQTCARLRFDKMESAIHVLSSAVYTAHAKCVILRAARPVRTVDKTTEADIA